MLLDKSFYLTQSQAGTDLFNAAGKIPQRRIEESGLDILLRTPLEEFQRISCLPTSFAVAVNLLCGSRVFGLGAQTTLNAGHILEVAVFAHTNDETLEDGTILKRGDPSIDRRTGNFYHAFLLGLAIRFNLRGVLIANLFETEKLISLIRNGAVILVSLDNLFVPQVSGLGRGITKLRVGRHVILLYDAVGNGDSTEFVYSDVFNPKPEDGFLPVNLRVQPRILNQYLWTNRQPQITPRMIALWQSGNKKPLEHLVGLSGFVNPAKINPVFCQYPGILFQQFLERLKIEAQKT